MDNSVFGLQTNSGKKLNVAPGPYKNLAAVKSRYNYYEQRRYNKNSNIFWFDEGPEILRAFCERNARKWQGAAGGGEEGGDAGAPGGKSKKALRHGDPSSSAGDDYDEYGMGGSGSGAAKKNSK